MLSRAGPAKAREKEFGHGDKARERAHRAEALQGGFNVDTQRGMTMHEVWCRQGDASSFTLVRTNQGCRRLEACPFSHRSFVI
jgi:hypothetical protein